MAVRARILPSRWARLLLLACLGLFSANACGDDAKKAPKKRGLGDVKKKKHDEAKPDEDEDEEDEEGRPSERPVPELTRSDFGREARDPFVPYRPPQGSEVAPEASSAVKQRDVKLRNSDLDDLKLIAIVRSGRRIRPLALFMGADGISKSIEQGQYFSRNEVLLASVNSDYIEIEIVDEDLAGSLEMQRGERRAIYLKKD